MIYQRIGEVKEMLKLTHDEPTKCLFAIATDKDARTCYLLRDQNKAGEVLRDNNNQVISFQGLLSKDASDFMTKLGKVN